MAPKRSTVTTSPSRTSTTAGASTTSNTDKLAPPPPLPTPTTSSPTTISSPATTSPQQQQPPPPPPAVSPFSFNFQPYLPPDAAERLARYKYAGEDRSWLYKYFWKPTCVTIVEHLPIWLAPNVITVGALVLVIISHLLLWWYMPLIETPSTKGNGVFLFDTASSSPSSSASSSGAQNEVPGWIFVVAGVTLFLYSLLDNLDGYQARRTKTASPLGLLTDHGCDALNAFISSLSIATAISLGATWKALCCVVISIVAFFMNTWEEYYRGSLVLPVINGPNEGIVVVIGLYFYTAYTGTAVWLDEVAYPSSWVEPAIDFGVAQYCSLVFSACSVSGTKQMLVDKFFKCSSQSSSTSSTSSSSFCLIRHSIPLMFMLAAGIVTIAGNLFQVFVALQTHKKRMQRIRELRDRQKLDENLKLLHEEEQLLDYESHGIYATGGLINRFPFIHAFNRLVPMAAFLVLAIWWFVASPSDIFTRHPRLFLWTIGFLITKLTLHLMIAHVCAIEFHPLRRTIIPFFTLAFHGLLLWLVEKTEGQHDFATSHSYRSSLEKTLRRPFLDSLNERVMLVEFFVLAAVTYMHAVVNIVWELTHVLGRRMFSIIELLEKQKNK